MRSEQGGSDSKNGKTLLLIPSVLKTGIAEAVATDKHPRMDYYALGDALKSAGEAVQFLDYGAVEASTDPLIKMLARRGGQSRDAALALMGCRQSVGYPRVFTNGENVAIPWALLRRIFRGKPVNHVTIGHHLSPAKKRVFYRTLHTYREMDKIFVYARTQYDYALATLGVPSTRLEQIHFHADTHFYRPMPEIPVNPNQICAAGLEWRDYPTLIEAVKPFSDLSIRLAAASPWSKHVDETADRTLPPNIDARRYEYNALRELYASSLFVVVPLYENDFQAGVTTLLEAMAMGKAVIITRTTGQTDVIIEGENGLTVAPGDVEGWRTAIKRLREDEPLRERLGRNARSWVEKNASLEKWVAGICAALGVSTTNAPGVSPVEQSVATSVTAD